jgi:hypothetical protein
MEETFMLYQLTRSRVENVYKFMLLGVLGMLWVMVMVYVVWFILEMCGNGIIIEDKNNSWQ